MKVKTVTALLTSSVYLQLSFCQKWNKGNQKFLFSGEWKTGFQDKTND